MLSSSNRIIVRYLRSSAHFLNRDEATKALIDRILRVDHAGECGAVKIYEGQLAVLGKSAAGEIVKEMKEGEEIHLQKMRELIPKHRVRPTALLPVWSAAGYILGVTTALMGKEAAMACTVAVETVIGEHYDDQIRKLMADGKDGLEKHEELIKILSKFRDEELNHLDTGIKNDAEKALFYNAMSAVIKRGCKTAIWISERV